MADIKKYYYLKLKDNFYDSEQMLILQNMQDGYLYSDILMKLYLRSLKSEGKLLFNNMIPYTPQVLAQVVRHQVGTVEKALQVFQKLGLIEVLDNGVIFMLDIQNFIGESSTEADRVRKYRNAIKLEKLKSTNVVQMYDKCTPEIDIDIDINKRKEIYKEKKSYKSYGEFKNVLLTDDEYHKLEESNLLTYIDSLSNYIASKGKKYRSHYATILTWSRKDKKEVNISDKKQGVIPSWLNKEIPKSNCEVDEEFKKTVEEFRKGKED